MVKPREDPLRIAIIGGGISGLFAAICLHHHCGSQVEIDVYEQAPEYKEIGAGIGIGINAAKLFHRLGLGERLNAISGDKGGVWLTFRRHDSGQEICHPSGHDFGDVRRVPCARTDLLDLLRSVIEERRAATLHTSKRFQRLSEPGSTWPVAVHFDDGSKAEADLVVGADGIHSAVRAQFQPDRPRFEGRIAYRGVVPIAALGPRQSDDVYNAIWVGQGRHFLTYPISGGRALNVVAFRDLDPASEEASSVPESWVSTCPRAEVQAAFAGFDAPVQRIIALLPAEPGRWKINVREPTREWSALDGRVVLLGDAAHAMLPHLGAGAGQGCEDGWVLGRCVADYLGRGFGSLAAAAGFYQTLRRPRAQDVQSKSRGAGLMYNLSGPAMEGKTYEEKLEVLASTVTRSLQAVWEGDAEDIYKEARKKAGSA